MTEDELDKRAKQQAEEVWAVLLWTLGVLVAIACASWWWPFP